MADKETVGDFSVSIDGSEVKAVHWEHGHQYSAHWSAQFPNLRNFQCRPNDRAKRSPEAFEQEARGAMMFKLRNSGLLKD